MSEEWKRLAGEAAVAHAKDGMTIGLGTGSTVAFTIEKLAQIVKANRWKIRGVPTSSTTERLARSLGLSLTTLDEVDGLDLAFDGADEVDPELNLIKGGGGAHFREKIVARAAREVVIVVDDSKVVTKLGSRSPVPVEVHPYGLRQAAKWLETLGCKATTRTVDGVIPFRTDNGNLILDCRFDSIADPRRLEKDINNIPGVLENGLFIGMADIVFVAGADGVRTLRATRRTS